jgi:hypothetical protein
MHEAKAAIQEYGYAMSEFLAHVRGVDRGFSYAQLVDRLYSADLEIERLGVRHSPAYNDAVLHAD